METEVKLSPVSRREAGRLFADPLLGDAARARRIEMDATYFDTPAGELRSLGAGIRLRRENGRGVVCLKADRARTGAAVTRLELEIEAQSIREGADRLLSRPELPPRVGEALRKNLVPVCSCVFTRYEVIFHREGLTLAVSYDEGELRGGGRRAPLNELEIELAEGEPRDLELLASALLERHSLPVCGRSKLARALELAGGER